MIEKKGYNGTGGGGGGQKTTVESTRNTITCTETATGWDIDVASEDALRYIIHNYKEFMEASVDIGTRYARGETTSCVMQLVDDIFMTDAKAEDEDLYTVNGNKLIDFANKTFKFGWYFFYTTILSDGNRRHLQLLYPDSGHLDTWQFQTNRVKFDNVHIGGGIALYNKHNKTNYDPQTASFSRYLLASVANLNYTITNCTIACCGANDNSFNPFIHEGNPSVHPEEQYHTNIKIINCDFFHGGDSHGGFWNNLNAPIVIYSDTLFGVNTSHQRIVVFKQLSKNINNDATETGCPHIQFRTVAKTDPSYDTQKAYWISHPWQLSSDGTALVTNTVDEACIVFEAKLALKDIYLQGNANLQPDNPSPDHNYVSLVEELLKRSARDYAVPEDFGAIGDGVSDDTEYVRNAVKYCDTNDIPLYFRRGKQYKITDAINYYDGQYNNVSVKFFGDTYPSEALQFGLIVSDGVSLFKNATITSSFSKMYIGGTRNLNTIIFDHCTFRRGIITDCRIVNFGVIFYNTPVENISRIRYNTFLTAYYLSRNTDTSAGFTDSFIENNYINGGEEVNDNSCMEWFYYNGSSIQNNFIDYYRTIYYPRNLDGSERKPSVLPNSIGNNYQVFRYLYAMDRDTVNSISFTSVGDTFNWTDPSKLEKLRNFVPLQISYRDQPSDMRDMPNYIFYAGPTNKIYVRGATIEGNCNNAIFLAGGMSQYSYSRFDVEITSLPNNLDSNSTWIILREGGIYRIGSYNNNEAHISGINRSVQTLPAVTSGWVNYIQGEKVWYIDKWITLKPVCDNGTWKVIWVDDFGQEVTS